MDALTEHGGRLDAAAARYPHAPLPWIDLSTGINPVPWIGDHAPIDYRALPDVSALVELEAAAAAHFGAKGLTVAALPGTEIGLRLLAMLDLPTPYFHMAPGYRTHAEALPGSLPIDSIEAFGGGTLLLANPNNPDGRILPPARLLDLARSNRDGWLIVDEAFADVVPEASIVPHLKPDDRVIVLRSFGKFFGLAGLRLGFIVGSETMVEKIRKVLGDWPVSSTTIVIGKAAYRDGEWIGTTRETLATRAIDLDAVLAHHGLIAKGDCPLFRLVDTDATSLFDHLARAGILTRAFDYDPRWLRFGLPEDAATLDRLDQALAHG